MYMCVRVMVTWPDFSLDVLVFIPLTKVFFIVRNSIKHFLIVILFSFLIF